MGTFGDFHISAVARQGAVDLSDQFHVVEKRVEAVEVRKADLVGCAATRNLGKDGDTYFNVQKNPPTHTLHSKQNKSLRDASRYCDYA